MKALHKESGHTHQVRYPELMYLQPAHMEGRGGLILISASFYLSLSHLQPETLPVVQRGAGQALRTPDGIF
jgi:hypothetical protein